MGNEEDHAGVLTAELVDHDAVGAEDGGRRDAAPGVVGAVFHQHDFGLFGRPGPELGERALATLWRAVGGQVGDEVAAVAFGLDIGGSTAALVVEHGADEAEVGVAVADQLLRKQLRVAGGARDGIAERHELPFGCVGRAALGFPPEPIAASVRPPAPAAASVLVAPPVADRPPVPELPPEAGRPPEPVTPPVPDAPPVPVWPPEPERPPVPVVPPDAVLPPDPEPPPVPVLPPEPVVPPELEAPPVAVAPPLPGEPGSVDELEQAARAARPRAKENSTSQACFMMVLLSPQVVSKRRTPRTSLAPQRWDVLAYARALCGAASGSRR